MQNDVTKLSENILNRIIQRTEMEQTDINYWEWNNGVLLFGIVKSHMYTERQEYLDYLLKWFEKNIPTRNMGSVNCIIPCYGAFYLYNVTGEEKYKKICEEYVDWCVNKSLKTVNGGIAHVWSVGGLEDYKNQLWIDSLFMAVIFMMKYGIETNNDELIKNAFMQLDIHINCQFDKENNLFYHGYHCNKNKPLGEHWGRGNGWAAVTLAELLELMKNNNYDYSHYEHIFKALMECAYSKKTDNGMLRTLILCDDSYIESTASMLFGYAALKGYKIGILDERFKDWALEILLSLTFTENGSVEYTSGGTDCQEKEGYYKVPYVETNYALGIALMFVSVFE